MMHLTPHALNIAFASIIAGLLFVPLGIAIVVLKNRKHDLSDQREYRFKLLHAAVASWLLGITLFGIIIYYLF